MKIIKNCDYVTFGEYKATGLTWGDLEKSKIVFGDLHDRKKFEELLKLKSEALSK